MLFCADTHASAYYSITARITPYADWLAINNFRCPAVRTIRWHAGAARKAICPPRTSESHHGGAGGAACRHPSRAVRMIQRILTRRISKLPDGIRTIGTSKGPRCRIVRLRLKPDISVSSRQIVAGRQSFGLQRIILSNRSGIISRKLYLSPRIPPEPQQHDKAG